jgi:hypothetical protein
MKSKMFAIAALVLLIGAVTVPAMSQELTNDVVVLRVGWIPSYTVSFDVENSDDAEFTGFAGMAEYNLNVSPVLIGFGIEYQRVVDDAEDAGDDDSIAGFLIPQVTAKFMAAGGFYIGAGLAGKYLINYDLGSGVETDKTIDLWVNGVIGYIAMISDGIYLDVMGRFGYNLTNNTWDELESSGYKLETKAKSAYDLAIYVGIGFKSFQTGL